MPLTNVSILLIVNEIASATITTYKKTALSFNNKEKKARSGTTEESCDTAIRPEKPIINTTGIMIKNEIIKLFFKTFSFFAA